MSSLPLHATIKVLRSSAQTKTHLYFCPDIATIASTYNNVEGGPGTTNLEEQEIQF